MSRRLGAGRWGAGARRRWRWGAGLGAGRWARRAGVQARRQQALGLAGTARACADGRGARGRARRARQARRAAGKAPTSGGARQALARGAGERAAGRGRSARQAGAGRARRTAWERGARGLGVPGRAWCTDWASLGLMQPVWVLTWIFDSVVFLSHRLDSVHEHCS